MGAGAEGGGAGVRKRRRGEELIEDIGYLRVGCTNWD